MRIYPKDIRKPAWLLPGVILVLMPKCPVCIAGYIAFATGIGISLALAESIRVAAMAICAAVPAVLAIKATRRMCRKSFPTNYPNKTPDIP